MVTGCMSSTIQPPTAELPWYLDSPNARNAIKQGVCQRVGGIHTIEAREGLTTKLREIGANAYNGGYVRRTLNRARFQFWAYVYTLPPDGGPSIRRTHDQVPWPRNPI